MNAHAIAQRLLSGMAETFNRNRWSSRLIALVPRDAYRHDNLVASHIHDFMDDPSFQAAYARAVQAAGWDYGIYWRVHVVLWAASVAQHAAGSFVECGTGRGFFGSAVCAHLNWTDRPFFMFDTFDAHDLKPDAAARGVTNNPVYATDVEAVRRNFAEWPGVQVVPGIVPASLATVEISQVAFLHVDMNHPDPEREAVRYFWPKLSDGAVVVFDDYAHRKFRPVHDSTDRLARELGFDVVALPTGQGVVIKH